MWCLVPFSMQIAWQPRDRAPSLISVENTVKSTNVDNRCKGYQYRHCTVYNVVIVPERWALDSFDYPVNLEFCN